MRKIVKATPTEGDLCLDDENDPVLKMLDDPKISTNEIFVYLGWEPMPADVREAITS
ncbi:MAG: hypothetical protein Q8K86_05525 [Candidatus Nanopelagicaceae bacterium]|nr:hypothetical protein [Candidatus Nanopelagicaceae bacterium]